MLDPNFRSQARLGITRDVARRPDVRRAGAQSRIDDDAVVDREARPLGEIGTWFHTDAEHDQIGCEPATFELDRVGVNRAQLGAEVKTNALLFVQPLHESAYLRSHDVFERDAITANYVHLEVSRAQ